MATKAEVRARIKAAEKELEEARRMVANDLHDAFTSEDCHKIAMAQYECAKAYEQFDKGHGK
jgi:hypothetical protein